MLRNRNGYWMCPEFYALFNADSGGGTGGTAGNESGATGENGCEGTSETGTGGEKSGENGAGSQGNGETLEALNAEIARLKAEAMRNKKALDEATHEASVANKALKARMTQEEIEANSKKEAEEKAAQELEDLRKEVAKGKTVKTVMGKLGLDEDTAGTLADCLYGAADIENALLNIQKAWLAKEKALKLEYGKIPPPGAGGSGENSPEQAAINRAVSIGKARAAANETAQKAMSAYLR